ncbi:MAG: hypothetical protein LUH47_08715 [Clostridiales bacterium]|nr:hypothetical protein [Clostridiales bacterium]
MTYIIKTDRNIVCYYYSGGRLLKRIRNERGLSAEYQLMNGVRPSFSLSLTEKGESCIFCRDLKGNVILIKEGQEGITRRVLLENTGNDFKGTILFDAAIRESEIELLYNTPSKNGAYNLYIQKLSEKTRPPHLIDGAYPLNNSVFRTVNVNSRLRLVFYLKRQGENKLGYREILDDSEGLFNTVFSSSLPFGDYSTAAGERGLYFAAVTNTFFSSRLYFRTRGNEGFSDVKAAAEMSNITKPLVFVFNGKPILFFKAGDKPYMAYDTSIPKPFKGKICPELSRGSFIDKTEKGRIKASEVLVDSNKPWDIQLYPEIDENFYGFGSKTEERRKPRGEYSFKDLFSEKGSVTL